MKQLVFYFTLFFASVSYSQSIRLEGTITDAAGRSLEMANVMAVNVGTKAMDAYAITNDKGRFALSLKPNATYTIKVSFLGFQTKEITITTMTENIEKVIPLEEGAAEIEGVEIVYEMPVSIKGDTIVYNADSFTSGTERKLEDVLKKLPGVEVNADGEVEVEGKKVTKLMVEGKDFFDGDTKLGVKNIPADAIDKIEVLRNYNDISALRGVENNTDNVAMNIKLKKGKKNFWFGDVNAGIGIADDETRYVANPKLFYYSPEYSINLIANFNNIGELPFTIQDYFKFTGGFRGMMQRAGTNFNISSNDLGLSTLRNNRAKEIETRFGATNFSYNATKAWTVSGFVIGSSTITDLETRTRTDILLPNSNQVFSSENRSQSTLQRSDLGLFKLSSSYKPTTALQFDYDALLKLSSQQEASNLNSIVTPNVFQSQFIQSDKDQSPISLNQNLSLYYTRNDKHVFAFETQHLYNEEDPFYNPNLGENPFPDTTNPDFLNDNIGIVDQNRFELNQSKFVTTNKVDSKLDYYYMVTPKSNINVTLGNTYSYQKFSSRIFQIFDDGSVNDLNPNTRNEVRYGFDDLFLGLHYKFITGKFTFNPGFSAHSYNFYNEQLGTKVSDKFYRILPDMYALYQMKKSETLTYNFAMTNDFTDINRFVSGFTFSDYNAIFRGNRELDNALTQVHSLRYFKYNMFNFTNIFANINYTRSEDAIKTRSVFDGNYQKSGAINIHAADESLSGAANYGRSFLRFYKASLGFSMIWSKFNNIRVLPNDINNAADDIDVFENTESFTQNYTLKASTNYKELPNIEVGYNIAVNDYNGTIFYTERPFLRLDYFFLDSFSFTSEYEFYHYYSSDNTTDNEYDFLTASLIYQKKNSKWEYKVSGTNLLNTTSLNDDNFNQRLISTSQYQVQPRYLIFSAKYNL